MNDLNRFIILLLFATLFFSVSGSPAKRHTISGMISDGTNGEDLIGVNVYVSELRVGTATNDYGFYSLTLPTGSYVLEISYLGYVSQSIPINLRSDQKLNIKLNDDTNELQEVIISGERQNINITRSEMSVEKLSSKVIKSVPAMMGARNLFLSNRHPRRMRDFQNRFRLHIY